MAVVRLVSASEPACKKTAKRKGKNIPAKWPVYKFQLPCLPTMLSRINFVMIVKILPEGKYFFKNL